MPQTNRRVRLEHFVEACRKNHLKVTPQRVTIYKLLVDRKDHPSADMVYRTVRKQFPNISFDTVNRTLLTFSRIGLIEVLEVQGGPRRYEPNVEPHHHFYCIECGQIVDVWNPDYDHIPVPEDLERRFDIRTKRVVLSGLCDKCKSA
jgi:Fur family peroxide stress response transcriptional regulator